MQQKVSNRIITALGERPMWIAELSKSTDISYQRCLDTVRTLLREKKIICIGVVGDMKNRPARINSSAPVYALPGTRKLEPASKRERRKKKFKGVIVGKPYRVDWRMSGKLCRDIFINKRMAEGAR